MDYLDSDIRKVVWRNFFKGLAWTALGWLALVGFGWIREMRWVSGNPRGGTYTRYGNGCKRAVGVKSMEFSEGAVKNTVFLEFRDYGDWTMI